jgi:hypothetical protein
MSENPVGRPTEYKPEYCEQLINHMAEGLSYETFGVTIGVSRATLYVWENAKNDDGTPKHPEWIAAKKQGFEACQIFYERVGRNMLLGLVDKKTDPVTGKETVIDYTKGNTTVWVFNMKNRFNWRDKVDHTSDNKPMRESVVIQLPSNGREKE